MDIVIRRATDDDTIKIEKFIEDTYGATAQFKGPARSSWQFRNNPHREQDEVGPAVWIALSGNDVVGQIAVQDGLARINGKIFPAGWIVDVMIRPEFRGLGLGHKIHECVMSDRSFLVTLTMAPATRRIAERASCITLGPTYQMICPISISGKTVSRFISYKLDGKPRLSKLGRLFAALVVGPYVVAGAINSYAILQRFLSKKQIFDSEIVEETGNFNKEIDALWNQIKDFYPAIFQRNALFLNWRFCKVPGLNYHRYILRKDGVLKGYLVTRVGTSEELPVGVIVDLFAHPEDKETISALIAHAIKTLSPVSEYLEAAATTYVYREMLNDRGFVVTKKMRPTIVCSDMETKNLVSQTRNNWHFSKADHDWDQVHPI